MFKQIHHYTAILSRSLKDLVQVTIRHNRIKNELEIFGIIATNI